MGNELSFFVEDLTKTISNLKDLETTSHSNSKIGLKTIRDSIKNLLALEEDVTRQLQDLESHFSE